VLIFAFRVVRISLCTLAFFALYRIIPLIDQLWVGMGTAYAMWSSLSEISSDVFETYKGFRNREKP
jgi:hypothetical protein